tara:strand:+ start:92 stop:244 length:153 start_codon:yes stop_codon:yes gene_type:complete
LNEKNMLEFEFEFLVVSQRRSGHVKSLVTFSQKMLRHVVKTKNQPTTSLR